MLLNLLFASGMTLSYNMQMSNFKFQIRVSSFKSILESMNTFNNNNKISILPVNIHCPSVHLPVGPDNLAGNYSRYIYEAKTPKKKKSHISAMRPPVLTAFGIA